MSCTGRYAPSPSGDLHLGNLRTALLAWLGARSTGGAFRLRIDDLDAARSRPQFAARQLADIAALGLTHDGPIPLQSERTDHYAAALASLEEAGDVYPCFCTRAEIREASHAPHGSPTAGYPGTCRDLTREERAARRAAGRREAQRFRADPEPVVFLDLVLGPQQALGEDAVLQRADGEFGYQLAVVLDDADQGVTEVARGADLLASVPTQLQLGERLTLPRPTYAHLPLMLGPDGSRLAKRHGAVTLQDTLEGRGSFALPGLPARSSSTPEAVRSALAATVGLCAPGEQPTLPELIERFAYEQMPVQSTIMTAACSN